MIKICTQCYARNNPQAGTGPRTRTTEAGLAIGLVGVGAFFLLMFVIPLPAELGDARIAITLAIPVVALLMAFAAGRGEACSGCGAAGALVPEDSPRGRALAAEAQRHAVAVPPPAVPPPQ